MKLLRLRVRAFRGLDERELTFAPLGVTIVQGPNEAGKSSLAEAIDLLLDEHVHLASVGLAHREVPCSAGALAGSW